MLSASGYACYLTTVASRAQGSTVGSWAKGRPGSEAQVRSHSEHRRNLTKHALAVAQSAAQSAAPRHRTERLGPMQFEITADVAICFCPGY